MARVHSSKTETWLATFLVKLESALSAKSLSANPLCFFSKSLFTYSGIFLNGTWPEGLISDDDFRFCFVGVFFLSDTPRFGPENYVATYLEFTTYLGKYISIAYYVWVMTYDSYECYDCEIL